MRDGRARLSGRTPAPAVVTVVVILMVMVTVATVVEMVAVGVLLEMKGSTRRVVHLILK